MPLGEDAESYEVDILDGASVVRTLTASAPGAVYPAAEQTADFGSAQPSYDIRVYQLCCSMSASRSASSNAVSRSR